MKNITEVPQIMQAGIFDSTVRFKNMTQSRERDVTKYEIEMMEDFGDRTYINGQEYHLNQNLIICAKPGQRRFSILPFRCYFVHIKDGNGELYHYLNQLPNAMQFEDSKKYQRIFRSLCSATVSNSENSDILQSMLLLELVYQLTNDNNICESRQSISHYADEKMIVEALKFIELHFQKDCNLQKIAEHVNLCPTYFHKCFTEAVGKTPHQYITERRLREVKELLLSTGMPLTEIAFSCGFTSQSYFNYVFKKAEGMSPGQYKKEMLSKYPV